MPKIYSAQKTLAFCRFSAPGIYFLEKVFRPIATVLVRSTTFLNKHFVKKSHNISVDELSHALELTDKAELSEENNILEGIIRFGGETVKEVMTSRLDMVDLDIRTSFKEVMQCIIENAYSRIPIYSGSRDNIKGVLYIKDLLPHVNKGDNFRWQSLIRPAYFVPETKMGPDTRLPDHPFGGRRHPLHAGRFTAAVRAIHDGYPPPVGVVTVSILDFPFPFRWIMPYYRFSSAYLRYDLSNRKKPWIV